jgi:hypothetical protein
MPPADRPPALRTTAGNFPLSECRIAICGREWVVLYTTAVITWDDEAKFLADPEPY